MKCPPGPVVTSTRAQTKLRKEAVGAGQARAALSPAGALTPRLAGRPLSRSAPAARQTGASVRRQRRCRAGLGLATGRVAPRTPGLFTGAGGLPPGRYDGGDSAAPSSSPALRAGLFRETAVRRSDKEVSKRSEIDAIVRGCAVCHLALAAGDEPYLVPLSYGYDGQSLYFHSAREGTKIDFMEKNRRACFNMVREVRLVPHETDGCKWTISFESVLGFGAIEEIVSPVAKAAALNWIMRQYSDRDWEFDAHVVKQTRVWRLRIESITGKRSQQKSI